MCVRARARGGKRIGVYYVSERIFCPALVPLQPQSHNTCARSQTSSVFDSKTPGRHHLFEDDCLVYAGGGRAAEDGWCQDYNGGNAEKIRTRVPGATVEKSDGNGDEHDCPDRNKDPARPSIQISGKPETPRLGAGRMGKIFSTTFSAPDPVQRGETAGMSPAAGKIKCCGGLRVMSEPPYRWASLAPRRTPTLPRTLHAQFDLFHSLHTPWEKRYIPNDPSPSARPRIATKTRMSPPLTAVL